MLCAVLFFAYSFLLLFCASFRSFARVYNWEVVMKTGTSNAITQLSVIETSLPKRSCFHAIQEIEFSSKLNYDVLTAASTVIASWSLVAPSERGNQIAKHTTVFYIRGSVHRNSRLKKSNEMRQYADIYLLLNYSTCFGRPSRQSSGVHKTVVADSGTDRTVWGASWSVPEAATTVLCTPDDGRDGRPKHVE